MAETRWMTQQPHIACEDCGAEFVSDEELVEHRRAIHEPSPGAIRCRLCGEAFGSAEELDRHLRHDHGVEVATSVPCGECGLVFDDPALLEEHIDQEHAQRAGMGQGP
jgi:hypothetical protein